jgi:hypothetical protein
MAALWAARWAGCWQRSVRGRRPPSWCHPRASSCWAWLTWHLVSLRVALLLLLLLLLLPLLLHV